MLVRGTFGSAALLMAALSLHTATARAQQKPSDAEQSLFDSANRERTSRHLPPLKWDETLAKAARKHALLMAQKNYLSHQFPGEPPVDARAMQEGARFVEIAENIAESPNPGTIHSQWMNSPPHRGNILDPDLDSIGISVAQRDGQFFAVQDFSHAVPNLTIEDQERQVAELLKARDLRILDYRSDARRACVTDGKLATKSQPLYVVRYETADLNELPANLRKELKRGHYQSAAVGACAPRDANSFSTFRLAVLLY